MPEGLETVEALLEDLSFRNLELHDREAVRKRISTPREKSGALVVSIGDWPSAAVTGNAALRAAARGSQPPSRAGAGVADLADYVRLLGRLHPGGVVSGRFADWRAPSVYRALAGQHNGYDVAYPAGTPIAAGWPGEVVSIANWYGTEYGITIQSPAGFRTTYGHLSPATRLGAWVNAGDIVGRVVRDHVDVKMRDASGEFVDFAHGVPTSPGGGSVATHDARASLASRGRGPVVMTLRIRDAVAPVARVLPPLEGPAWTRRAPAVRAAMGYLRVRHQEASLLLQPVPPAPATLSAVRRRVDEARGRLLVNAVPEDVLLAAFLPSGVAELPGFWAGDLLPDESPLDAVATLATAARDAREDARQALPLLKRLLGDLNARLSPAGRP